MAVAIDRPAPEFTLRDQHRNLVSLDDLRGEKTLLVFMPYAFSRVCTGEVCELRDNLGQLHDAGTQVVVITTDSFFTNAAWARQEGLEYPILADFWPHGSVAQAYGTFNEKLGVANRTTFVLDKDGIVRSVIAADEFGQPRSYDAYVEALDAI